MEKSPLPKRHCLVCGKEFYAKHGRQILCGSPECREKRRNLWLRKKRLHDKKYREERNAKLEAKILHILGKSCAICRKTVTQKHKRFHNKYFRRHPSGPDYVLKHIEEFVLVCWKCHQGLHFLHDILGMSWEQILSLKEKMLG